MKIRYNWYTRTIAVLLVVLSLSCIISISASQGSIYFTRDDVFAIPKRGAVVRFAGNVSCSQATLENDEWVFRNFRLNNAGMIPIFRVAADNCSITITSCRTFNSTTTLASIRYVTSGLGRQAFNIGSIDRVAQWYVTFNGVYVVENRGYQITSDSTITVTGATANVSLTCYNFSGTNLGNSNQPFYVQHSIVITTLIIASVGLVFLIAIRMRIKRTEL